LVLYYRFGRRGQNLVMLTAGSVFFALFDVRFLACVYVSIVFAFAIAQAMDGTASPRSRQRLLTAAIVGHLGLLGYVKYCNFFLDGLHGMLDRIGIDHSFAHLDILLPVGISFYTFQTLGYLIAVYRCEVPAEHDLLTFAV